MELGKAIFAFAIAMVLSISTLTMMINDAQDQGGRTKMSIKKPSNYDHDDDRDGQEIIKEPLPPPSKRVSRFLATSNPRAADHCRRNNAVCTAGGNKNSTCCNNKCVDLSYDDDNCGACKKRCPFTQACCRGRCVYLAYDPRHCGECNNRCKKRTICFYGMCNYGG